MTGAWQKKTVKGKQCKILWHVDDLKIPHVDPDVVTDTIKTIDKEFGQEAPITVKRGKVHDYLGMTLDLSTEGKAKIKMLDYVEGMLADLPVDMAGESATPAADHLIQFNTDEPIKLDEEKSQFFHHYVEKIIIPVQERKARHTDRHGFLMHQGEGARRGRLQETSIY